MPTDVVLSLPEDVYDRASHLARLMNRDVAQVLSDMLENALSPLGSPGDRMTPVEELSGSELLAAAELRMDEEQGNRLGELLDHQQAETLTDAQRSELAALTQVYHECLMRKAQALREAVRRGLIESLDE